jgi:sec-independent protein translocase protein TatB
MFDFAWSEIALIGAVALIAIGPKDMPAAIRTVSSMVKKARRMAAEFQTHVDEMVREADLGDVKKAFNDIRNLDLSSAIERHVDPDRTIRNTFNDNPLEPTYPTPTPVPEIEVAEQASPPVSLPSEGLPTAGPEKPLAPAFIPPGMVPPAPPAAAAVPEPPAFIPPEAVRLRQSKA